MKIARFEAREGVRLGVVEAEYITSITDRIAGAPAEMIELIERWSDLKEAVSALPRAADYAIADVTMLAPVPRPGKIMGIGLNYADHAAEAGLKPPEHQIWFTKAVTAVTGPYAPIERPLASMALDYEAEMVMIIGKRCRHVSREQAESVIFGFCVGNDVSVRDWQHRSGQFAIGKSFDTHAPFGPYIVTADEVDVSALDIRCLVNGEERQHSNTSHLIFDCFAQIEHLSQAMTLEPGDVIYTGTPSGVGAVMAPPQWLVPGDRVRVEIEKLGHIENVVIAEPAA
ncbi:fumarylacetoacetate hydrolase family protein [Novosphingobium colocasiae]|uniref:Fumarylacetoacetase-like C-terminal domain-containing protein n=1 Tax=Novosphingobium colocasiae TaxID=1256513 RepID=A0A918PMT5_9SPHN|nr:fumarylacetoacetate hydrolase family protein [Novosphingobium colocasiae]GGZ15183.1 hypothetical protein GCM10011614_32630 [Novosphingobium colocasiae]